MEKPNAMKKRFDIDEVFEKLRAAVKPFNKAMLFELAEEGFDTPFEQLVACLISIRTLDEVSLKIAEKLFRVARTPKDFQKLSAEELAEYLRGSQYPFQKALNIKEIADRVVNEFEGELPCDEDVLLSFKGVGPKCANLVLGIACKRPRIGVDVHVHRVTNRWGYVAAPTPEKTMRELEAVLPRKYWIEINALLVPFGKHICTGPRPHCPTCPLLSMCRQVGVASRAHRVKAQPRAPSVRV